MTFRLCDPLCHFPLFSTPAVCLPPHRVFNPLRAPFSSAAPNLQEQRKALALIRPIGRKTNPGLSCSDSMLREKDGGETLGVFQAQDGGYRLGARSSHSLQSQASLGAELRSPSQAGIRCSCRSYQKLGIEATGFRDKDSSSTPFIQFYFK